MGTYRDAVTQIIQGKLLNVTVDRMVGLHPRFLYTDGLMTDVVLGIPRDGRAMEPEHSSLYTWSRQ